MTQYVMRLPDLGEGLVSAEISEWHVQTGDIVREDQPLVEMSTDKALVEVAAPVSGRVVSLSGAPGESIAVGAPLVIFDLDDMIYLLLLLSWLIITFMIFVLDRSQAKIFTMKDGIEHVVKKLSTTSS